MELDNNSKIINAAINELKNNKVIDIRSIIDTIVVSCKDSLNNEKKYLLTSNGLIGYPTKSYSINDNRHPSLSFFYTTWKFNGSEYISQGSSTKYYTKWSGSKMLFEYQNSSIHHGLIEFKNDSIYEMTWVYTIH